MKSGSFENWLVNIFNTQDIEISCTECFELVSPYVEMEATGQDAAAQLPLVKKHLGQCRACREEYETLRDLRRLEDEGEPPSIEDLSSLIS